MVATHEATAFPPTTAWGNRAWFNAAVARNNLSRTFATARSIRSRMSQSMLTVCTVQRDPLSWGSCIGAVILFMLSDPRLTVT